MIVPNSVNASVAAAPSTATVRGALVRVIIVSLLGSLPVIAHEHGRASLIANDRNRPEEGIGQGDDHRRCSNPAGQAARRLIKTPEGMGRQRARLRRADVCTRGGVVVADDE